MHLPVVEGVTILVFTGILLLATFAVLPPLRCRGEWP